AVAPRFSALPEVGGVCPRGGGGLPPAEGARLRAGKADSPAERLSAQIVSSELDADKMDYLLRDSLYCGVRYGSYDLDRVLDTVVPPADPAGGGGGGGGGEGGGHAPQGVGKGGYYKFLQGFFKTPRQARQLHPNKVATR